MIKVVAKRYLKEGVLEQYAEVAKVLVESSRAEAGCIDYGLYYGEAENVAVMIETWESREALAVHAGRLKAENWGEKLNAFAVPGKVSPIEVFECIC